MPPRGIIEAIDAGTEAFLRAWYGEPDAPIVVADGAEPHALRAWWAFEAAWRQPLTHQNHIVRRSVLDRGGDDVDFYVENQAVVIWSYRVSEAEQVHERNHGEDERRAVGADLATFLTAVAVLEATFGPHVLVANEVRAEDLTPLLEAFQELPLQMWPGCRFWAADAVLANVVPFDDPAALPAAGSTSMVMFSGRTPDALDPIAATDSIEWDFDSRLD